MTIRNRFFNVLSIGCLVVTFFSTFSNTVLGQFEFQKGDHVCFVGNALGERMQHQNFFETLVHQSYPTHQLVLRNLCFPGDEPLQRDRSQNFGDPDVHLKHSKANVIFFFFGFNESFEGKMGIAKFKSDLKRLVSETKKKSYDDKSAPRMVLVSPIAFENTGDKNLPNSETQNKNLELYTVAMQEIATASGIGFVDLFHPTKALFEKSGNRLTLNGAHLNAAGYQALAPIFLQQLTGKKVEAKFDGVIQKEIADKNFHWWHRYRSVNGYSIYGARGLAGKDGSNTYNNRDVMERERAILDQMTANRDVRIWALASGKEIAAEVDDTNTLPFFEPTTNVGGANDPNRKRGKLGSLDYLSADKQQKLFKLPDGYKISVVATEEEIPELANPVAINFDKHGQLWVATMPSYPHWKPKSKMDDKIIILKDKNKDGRMDDCVVFADGLHQPTGFEIGYGGAFIAQQPDVLFLKDTNGDEVADSRVRKLVGFDTADSHHGIAAFEWGPAGGLYFQEGTFKYSQVESPYGLTRLSEAGIWRYDPRTEKFEAHVSFAFANPWGHVFDKYGQNFIADASPGFNYWATPISGHVVHPDKHTGGSQYRRLNKARLEKQGDYPRFLVKRTRPSSGCEFITSSHFPPEFQNNFLVNNVIGERSVLNHSIEDDGSGFGGQEVERLVFCEDGNFRPVDLTMGPDGALYICDWHNALIGHLQHNLRDPSRDHSHGRIWKVTYEGRPLVTPPKIAGASIPELLSSLSVYEDRNRYRVKTELAERKSADVIKGVRAWVKGLDKSSPDYERMLLEALWQHQSHNDVEEILLQRVLESPDFRVRAAATRVVSFWRDQLKNPLAMLSKSLNDEHPRVRLEAVRACSFIISEDSLELALDAVKYDMDKWMAYAVEETVRTLTTQLSKQRMMSMHDKSMAMKNDPKMPKSDKPEPGVKEPAMDTMHDHLMMTPEPVVFLDKERKVIRFQLDRLTDSELLAIKPQPENPNYAMVSMSLLSRESTPDKARQAALDSYMKLTGASVVKTVLDAMEFSATTPSGQIAKARLAKLLASQPVGVLKGVEAELVSSLDKKLGITELSGLYAALISIQNRPAVEKQMDVDANTKIAFLKAVPLVKDASLRSEYRGEVVSALRQKLEFRGKQLNEIKRSAIHALASIPSNRSGSFDLISRFVASKSLKNSAVKALLGIPAKFRSIDASRKTAIELLKQAEGTKPKDRTSTAFLDAAELTSQLLVAFPATESKKLRNRLRAVAVRVVRIHTVEEEMRYDTPYFAVEAGRPVQVVLINEDLMPHNLVITAQGSIREVAELAGQLGPTDGVKGKQYVPKSNKVLQATSMVPGRASEALTFTAPTEPGEYPFVCTFPRHWQRMYGVMVVVKDLDAWQKNPVPPKDPIGSNRSFVQKWTMEDFSAEVAEPSKGASEAVGAKLFNEGTCAQCHKLDGEGGAVGPDLAEVFKRQKNDRAAVLREILEPSYKIEPKYEVHLIQTFDGLSISGIITSQDQNQITIIANPENPKPTTILRDDIEAMKKTASSLMPKALLDNFRKDEIMELLNYIESKQK